MQRRGIINILSIALIYLGTVFGAGFASGQEVVSFFAAYGKYGIIGAVVCGFLFIIGGGFVAYYAKSRSLQNTDALFSEVFRPKTAKCVSAICFSFLVVSFCIMITGCGTTLSEQFGLHPILGGGISLVLCFHILRKKVSGLQQLNLMLTPFLLLGVLLFCVLCKSKVQQNLMVYQAASFFPAMASCVLYFSFNTLSAVAVLVSGSKIASSEKEAFLGGALGGTMIMVSLVFLTVILAYAPETHTMQLPLFFLVGKLFPKLELGCTFLLYGAMLTTAASSGVTALERASGGESAVALSVLALVSLLFPFATLVQIMYTGFGLFGLPVLYGFLKIITKKTKG